MSEISYNCNNQNNYSVKNHVHRREKKHGEKSVPINLIVDSKSEKIKYLKRNHIIIIVLGVIHQLLHKNYVFSVLLLRIIAYKLK